MTHIGGDFLDEIRDVLRYGIENVDDAPGETSEEEAIALHLAYDYINVVGFDYTSMDLGPACVLGVKVAAAVTLACHVEEGEGSLYAKAGRVLMNFVYNGATTRV